MQECNKIYTSLVEDSNDIVGLVAYSIYKRHKIDYVEQYQEHNHRQPSTDEIKVFQESSCIDGSLQRYRMEATDIIREMYAAAMSENIDAIKKQVELNQKEHLRQIVPSGWKAFWLGVLQSIAGALVFAILLAAFAFVVRHKGTDFDNITQPQNTTTIVAPK